MIEVWENIKGFDNYQISSFGNIERIGKTKLIKLNGTINNCGYKVFSLRKDGKTYVKTAHKLVAEHFIENKHNYKFVNHIDGDKTNPKHDNLEWCTHRENLSHAWKNKKTSSKYTGVSWNKLVEKWESKIRINGKSKHIGTFRTELGAYLAYVNELELNNITNKYA